MLLLSVIGVEDGKLMLEVKIFSTLSEVVEWIKENGADYISEFSLLLLGIKGAFYMPNNGDARPYRLTSDITADGVEQLLKFIKETHRLTPVFTGVEEAANISAMSGFDNEHPVWEILRQHTYEQ